MEGSVDFMNSHRAPKILLAVAATATALAYLPGLTQFFVSDDFVHIYEHLRSPALRFLVTNWRGAVMDGGHYRPLFNIAYWWLPRPFGLDPIAYHLFVYGLQLIICLGLYRFSLRLTGSKLASAMAVIIYASHRLCVWAVVWAHAGPPIVGAFYLFTLLSLLHDIPHSPTSRRTAANGLLVFLSLLAGEPAFTLPFVAAILILCLEEGSLRDRISRMLARIWPAIFALFVYGIVRISVLGGPGGYFGTEFAPTIGRSMLPRYVEHLTALWVPFGLSFPKVTWSYSQSWNQLYAGIVVLPVVGALLFAAITLSPRRRVLLLGLFLWTLVGSIFSMGMQLALWRLLIGSFGWAAMLALLFSGCEEVSRRNGRPVVYLAMAGMALYWVLHLSGFSREMHGFKQAGAVTKTILCETMHLLPEPPVNGYLCFEGVPDHVPSGPPVFKVGLEEALRILYKHESIRVCLAHRASPEQLQQVTHWLRFSDGHMELLRAPPDSDNRYSRISPPSFCE